MKIFFVCHRLPFPPNRGGKIRPFNMIRHLGRKHSVVVASVAHSEQELGEGRGLKEHCAEVIAEVLPESVRWAQACGALVSRLPSSVAYFWSDRLYRKIQESWKRNRYDLVFVHCAFMGPYVTPLKGGSRLLDFGDLDSAKWLDYAGLKAWPLSWGYRLEAAKLRRYEQNIAGQFDQCTVTTQGEMEEFQRLGVPTPCTLIPNGVDTHYFSYRSNGGSGAPLMVFLGRMDYYPNIDGVLYFVDNIYPIIRRAVPQAQFRIIGSNPGRKIRALQRVPGVTVTGHVPDVRPLLADATVSIAPLRIARGTQNKLLESMAAGIPVVVTPEAARGVQATGGKHLLLADSPQSFAGQVITLLQDHRLREELSRAARQQVETAHTWSHSMTLLEALLDSSPSS